MPSGALENQRAVGATKTEIVFDSYINPGVSRGVCATVQVTFSVLIEDIDGGRNFLMMQSQHGLNRLNAACATQQMTGH